MLQCDVCGVVGLVENRKRICLFDTPNQSKYSAISVFEWVFQHDVAVANGNHSFVAGWCSTVHGSLFSDRVIVSRGQLQQRCTAQEQTATITADCDRIFAVLWLSPQYYFRNYDVEMRGLRKFLIMGHFPPLFAPAHFPLTTTILT